MPTFTDQALCIRHWDWSETSQTVSLLCREHGLIRAVAKGSKRENSKFSGGVDLLTHAEVVGNMKAGDALTVLFSWDLRETFPIISTSLASFHAGMFIADAIHHGLAAHDPHPMLFDAALVALRTLDRPATSVARFLWSLLRCTGHKPELNTDIESGLPLAQARAYRFLPRRGGLTSDKDHTDGTTDGNSWRVRVETVNLLRAIEAGCGLEGDEYSALDAGRAAALLAYYLRELIQMEPPSMASCLSRLGIKAPSSVR